MVRLDCEIKKRQQALLDYCSKGSLQRDTLMELGCALNEFHVRRRLLVRDLQERNES